jgi:hypothetical protein
MKTRLFFSTMLASLVIMASGCAKKPLPPVASIDPADSVKIGKNGKMVDANGKPFVAPKDSAMPGGSLAFR